MLIFIELTGDSLKVVYNRQVNLRKHSAMIFEQRFSPRYNPPAHRIDDWLIDD
jgi:hypothetical protein